MKPSFSRDLLTGVVSLAGLVGLGATLWLIGDLKGGFQRHFTFDLKIPAAGGITTSSPVTFNGVRVGKVEQSRLDPATSGGVLVTLSVQEGVEIPRDFTVYIDRSFVGQTTIQLEAPERPRGAGAITAVGVVREGEVLERKSTSLYDLVFTPLKEPLEKFSRAADSFDRLASTYTDLGKDLREELAPRSPADVDAGKPPTLRSVITRLDSAAAGLTRWLGDDALRTDAKGLVAKADGLIEKAGQTAETWTKAGATIEREASRVSASVDGVTAEATAALRKVSDASEQLTQLTAGVNRGEGTLGQLAKNPELYNSLRDAADRLERALREVQLLVQKYKDEGIPIKF